MHVEHFIDFFSLLMAVISYFSPLLLLLLLFLTGRVVLFPTNNA